MKNDQHIMVGTKIDWTELIDQLREAADLIESIANNKLPGLLDEDTVEMVAREIYESFQTSPGSWGKADRINRKNFRAAALAVLDALGDTS